MTSSMPVNNPAITWNRFLVAFSRLTFLPLREDAAWRAEAFLSWRDQLLGEMGSDQARAAFGLELQRQLDDAEAAAAARLMLLELDGFTTYVERLTGVPIAPDVQFPEGFDIEIPRDRTATKESWSVVGTTVDSIRDLLATLPFYYKALLKAASELASIWKEFG